MVLCLKEIKSERLSQPTPTATVAKMKKRSYLVVYIGLESSVDSGDEGGGDRRKDISLVP